MVYYYFLNLHSVALPPPPKKKEGFKLTLEGQKSGRISADQKGQLDNFKSSNNFLHL
jgi:hypothetical protein